jgi:hypothetical protein
VKSTSEFIESLRKRGYTVKHDVSIKGVSGVRHHADVLAEHPNGSRIIGVEAHGKEAAAEIIGTYVVALDSKANAFYITDRQLNEEGRKLARSYKITCLAKAR